MNSKVAEKSLSQKPIGYVIAAAGGLIGSPFGLILSLIVLFILNNIMSEKDGKHPNRFLVWAAIGIIGVPISWVPIIVGANTSASRKTTTNQPQTEMVAEEAQQQPPETRRRTGVNMENYLKLQNGMSYQEVVSILGEEGEELSSNELAGISNKMYMWKAAGFGGANMNAMFQDGALVSKSQFGLK